MNQYISDLDFGIENPTPIICMCDTPAEQITIAYVESLNNYFKKISREIYT